MKTRLTTSCQTSTLASVFNNGKSSYLMKNVHVWTKQGRSGALPTPSSLQLWDLLMVPASRHTRTYFSGTLMHATCYLWQKKKSFCRFVAGIILITKYLILALAILTLFAESFIFVRHIPSFKNILAFSSFLGTCNTAQNQNHANKWMLLQFIFTWKLCKRTGDFHKLLFIQHQMLMYMCKIRSVEVTDLPGN